MEGKESWSSFPMGETAQEKGLSYVPECYKIPNSHRPSLSSEEANIPVVDLTGLNNPMQRSTVVKNIGNACHSNGFFQIINHGIAQSVMDGALSTAFGFFGLPNEEKTKFMSNDVYKPVRYSSSLRDGVDKIQFWRVFLKHYAHPLDDWVNQWPSNPPDYREKMSAYTVEVRKAAIDIMGAITESLGIGPKYLEGKMVDGVQTVVVNCYPPCPQPELALGLPPHSDYSCLTIVLHNSRGLEILDNRDRSWRVVPDLKGTLQVHVGDHLEVLSNGLYKSVVHRATLNRETTRMSIASLHSLGMDEKVGTAKELVDEEHPIGYKESSFKDFLDFLKNNDIAEGKSFINTLSMK